MVPQGVPGTWPWPGAKEDKPVKLEGPPLRPILSRLCYPCYAITMRFGYDVKHRACYAIGCHCWCSFSTGHSAD